MLLVGLCVGMLESVCTFAKPKNKHMKVINDTQSLRNFEAWSGAVDTKNAIVEAGKEDDFEALIDELYPDGLTDTHLNDLLWFESEWIFDSLGIKEEEEETEEEEEE